MSDLQKARQALSWMESELHSRGLKDEERHNLAYDVRCVLNVHDRLAEALRRLVRDCNNLEYESGRVSHAASEAEDLLLEIEEMSR